MRDFEIAQMGVFSIDTGDALVAQVVGASSCTLKGRGGRVREAHHLQIFLSLSRLLSLSNQ